MRPQAERALDAFARVEHIVTPEREANLWHQDAVAGRVVEEPEHARSPYRLVVDLDRDGAPDAVAIGVRGDSAFVVSCFSRRGGRCGSDPISNRVHLLRLTVDPRRNRAGQFLLQECMGGYMVYPLWPSGYERPGFIDTMTAPIVVGPGIPRDPRTGSHCWG